MNGAPAKPISGTGDAARIMPIASSSGATAAAGSKARRRATSAADRIGAAITGPRPSTISKSTPEAGQRGGDVGEQDRRVDAEPADRLEGDLGAERRVAGDLDQRRPLADGPVLGEGPAGLAHEPDRRGVDRLAAAGSQEAGRARVGRRGRGDGSRARRGDGIRARRGDGSRRAHRPASTAAKAVAAAASVSSISASPWASGDEPGLELRRRQQDAGVEHRAEEAAVGGPVGGRTPPRPSPAHRRGRRRSAATRRG